ncbi:uncharacterized protein FA14DRAFT_185014 [Meira miltonrushii]|uniref:Nuclease associated modular domain-containing protein n=1 Tax=Meira miltonrushii TaxID=1280837 RepID=A0A316V7J5_9BASI|nr:uncharacterized protein FA14DRAFT_185014 [Meira miltonrushii]PWN33164.1 hypothetical protein FA14DRAFT_185014 [Meira miltonrushii]
MMFIFTMQLFRVPLLVLVILGRAYAPISPGEIDSGWLTLATGGESQQSTSREKSGNPIQTLQTAQLNVEVSTPVSAANQPVQKKKGSHFLSPEHIESIRASWTPERRKRQAELARLQTFTRGPEYKAKIRASWTEERKAMQSQLSRARRLGKPHSNDVKMKLSKALTGKLKSQETKEKMRKSRLGKCKSEATKQKIAESLRRSKQMKKEMLQDPHQTLPKQK